MKGIFTAIIVIFNFLIMDAQSKLDNAITNLEENYSQEKVYILFDKDQYVAGDQILFQSFVFDGYNLSSISKTLYVELYDQSKNLIDKRTILINNGKASGLFELSKTLTEDVYFVRAYTNWMANFDNEWNFIKPIPIYNSTSKKKLVPSVTSKWSVVVFPEGGTFIDKTSTKIAVRINHQGKPAKKWSGYLIDSELPDNKIISFQSLDENIAIFQMTPQFGKTYKVVVEDGEGNSQISTLPTVTDKGINLKITSDKSSIKYTINAVKLENSVQNYNVVGTINNQLAYKAKIKSTNSQVASVIPTKEIKQNGILQISIFDDRDHLVAQRLCFLNHSDLTGNTIAIQNSNFNNQPRTLNSFDINENPNSGNYTVLVKDVTDIDSSQDDILSNLFLTQDLKNQIKNPAQYFTKTANTDALDALLISEKWKRFDWTKLLAGQKPLIKYNLTDNEFISYTARLALNSRPLPDTLLNLVFKTDDGEPLLSQLTTDKNGDILISNLNFDDSYFVNYFLNSNDKQQTNLTLKLKPVIDSNSTKLNFPRSGYELIEASNDNSLPPAVEKAFANAQVRQKIVQDETQIEEVKIVKKKSDAIKKLNDELTSGMFSSMNATIFDFVNDNQDAFASLNILEWLQGRVAGLSIMMVEPGKYMPVIRGVEAGVFLDEMNVGLDAVQTLSINSIAMVKIIKGSRLIGNSILIYTRTANLKTPTSKASNSTNKVEIKAYDKIIAGKMIDYSQEKYRSSVSDWRQVLYWNPEFTNSTVNFYNNDNAKNRELTIIGFDKENKLLYYNQTVE
ncbi:hypothetical protein [Epilithonimonas lactis]|uniref:Uncharacterized protein n=1 Tax=Epilithonimonas lactis TaxID=421072 RepID=A0A085B968_9FLAO|nr:hypothetical protein [Epilithonimonas lactis]KFC19013.1 hypothetical protein IO89_15955 [Epilithonimonas lactis]SEQ95300.1 hypothetical protein SAMN04488097_3502 [Epilithonimonas lactis]